MLVLSIIAFLGSTYLYTSKVDGKKELNLYR
jgi:hypothetical protein